MINVNQITRPFYTGTTVDRLKRKTIPSTDDLIGDGTDRGNLLYPYALFEKQFYSRYSVSANNIAEVRGMGFGIPEHGYDYFFDRFIDPDIAKGIKRFHIHLPHGTEVGQVMSYDALLEAIANGDTFAYEGFYERMLQYAALHPDVVFLCYFGTLRRDQDISLLLDNNRISEWLERVVDSILPAIEAVNIDIGFDASYGDFETYTADHPHYFFLSLIKSLKAKQGRLIYGEPRPQAESPWWFDFPLLSTEAFWNRSDPDKFADSTLASTNNLAGPILRMERRGGPKNEDGSGVDWRDWLPERIANVLINDANVYGPKFQCSHGIWRILHTPENGITYGAAAENIREIYDRTVEFAISQNWLS